MLRTPPAATVWAIDAITSGVARTLNWPIAVEPTSSGVRMRLAGGRVLGSSPGMLGDALKP